MVSVRVVLSLVLTCVVVSGYSRKAVVEPPPSLSLLRALGDQTSCLRSCQPCLNRTKPSKINRKFFFLHIPKTGGLSIEMDIRKIVCNGEFLKKNQCFNGRNHSQFESLSSKSFRYRSSAEMYGWRDFSVFSGHEGWGMIPGFAEEAQPVIATIVREPIARAISHWNMVAGRSYGFNNSNNVSFSEAIKESIAAFGSRQKTLGHVFGSAVRNEQLKYLCGVDGHDSMSVEKAVILARRNLLRTAIIGTHEDMDGFLDQFRAVLPWWPPRDAFLHFSKINHARETRNVMKRRHHKIITREEMSADSLKSLTEFLAPELELYAFARQLAQAKTSWARECSSFALSQDCQGYISDCH